MKELYKALSDRAIEIYEISEQEIESIAEAYHKSMLEASPPVEVEPVAEVVYLSIDSFNGSEKRLWQTIAVSSELEKGTKLFTSPPDTEAKLKRAVEALKDLVEMCITHVGEDYDGHIHKCYIQGKQALKDIGEIK